MKIRIFNLLATLTFLFSSLFATALVPQSAAAAFQDPIFGKCKVVNGKTECTELNSYEEWIAKVWNWALIIMIPLSAIVLAWAGLIYTTSEGNPQRIGLAKKYIIGVVSGVALLILARVFLVGVLGMPATGGAVWNVKL